MTNGCEKRLRGEQMMQGQMNFFMEFDVCFYRSQFEFEVKPKAR
jgi:hypothetical protein